MVRYSREAVAPTAIAGQLPVSKAQSTQHVPEIFSTDTYCCDTGKRDTL